MNLKKVLSVVLVLMLFTLGFTSNAALAAMTSTNYQILWDSVDAGGSNDSSSTSYKLHDSIENVAGSGTSTNYSLKEGYRGGIYDRTVNFNVLSESRSYQVGATVLSGTTVTVSSTSSYSVGSYIAIIQDEGASQVAAMGKVTSLTSTTMTVDALNTGGSTPTIDGVNDVVYLLIPETSLSFGTLTTSTVSTILVGWEASADVSQGYGVYVMEDQDLTASGGSGSVLTDVSDGSVTAGATEYGARSSDTSLASSTFDTVDSAITTTPQQIASRGDNSLYTRDFLTLKASVATGATSAMYSQALTVIFVGDY